MGTEASMKYNLTIGAFEWVLDDSVEESRMDNSLGLCDFEKLDITIKKDLNEQIKKSTVLHELGHAFFASAGFNPKEEERVVDIYANQLFAFLKKNKAFVKEYFLEDEKTST